MKRKDSIKNFPFTVQIQILDLAVSKSLLELKIEIQYTGHKENMLSLKKSVLVDLSSFGILAKIIDVGVPKCQSKQTQVYMKLKQYEFRDPAHDKLTNVNKLVNIGHSDLILSVS